MSALVPLGCLRWRDVVHAVGRAMFPGAWTGEEDKADSDMVAPGEAPPLPARGTDAPGSSYRPRHRPSSNSDGAQRAKARPVVMAPRKDTETIRREIEKRDEEWIARNRAPDTPEYRQKYEANKAALERWPRAYKTFIKGLQAGTYTAVALNPWTGKPEKIEPERWNLPLSREWLRKERAPVPSATRTEGALYILEFTTRTAVKPVAPAKAAPVPEVIAQILETADGKKKNERLKQSVKAHFKRQGLTVPDRRWLDSLRAARGKRPDLFLAVGQQEPKAGR